MKKDIIFIVLGILILLAVAYFLFRPTENKKNTDSNLYGESSETDIKSTTNSETMKPDTNTKEAPKLTIDSKKTYIATMKTSEGDMEIELFASKTPITVNNFVTLARDNFYNNTVFHRVIDGFMIQGGDPEGTGAGGPGYKFNDEPFEGEYLRGTIAMANAGPNTNGSQFFIMHKDYPLPKNYVIFGRVTKGIEVVDKIATAETTVAFGGENSKPVKPVKVLSVSITEK